MNYHLLGKSTLEISEIGFGCMSLSEDEHANGVLINKALDLGINFFDTANIYQGGLNEITLGNMLKNKRSKVIIATKAGNQLKKDGSGLDWNPRKAHILSAADESLKRLQTDYIDLYQLHGGTIEDPIDETIEAFEILKAQGKIRFYGISSIRPNVINEYVKRSNIVSVMMQYGLLDRRPAEICLSHLKTHSIGVLARGSLAKGLLVDKPAAAFLTYNAAEVKKAADTVRSFSNENRSPSQTALRFALSHPAINTAVVGLRTIRQLEDVVKTTSTSPLSESELHALSNAIAVNFYDQHR